MAEKFEIRIKVYNEEPDFGKGIAILLEGVEREGSLSGAYHSIGMSASKAWKILNRAEKDLNMQLVKRETGGAHGGKSTLTDAGKQMLDRYRAFVNEVDNAAKISFQKYFGEEYLLVTFPSTTMAMAAEDACREKKKEGRIIPVPGFIKAGCGLAYRSKNKNVKEWIEFFDKEEIDYEKIQIVFLD